MGNVCNSGPPVPEAGWSIIEEPAISFPLWGNDLRLAKPLERTFWLWKGRLRVRPGEAGTGNEKTDALHEKRGRNYDILAQPYRRDISGHSEDSHTARGQKTEGENFGQEKIL